MYRRVFIPVSTRPALLARSRPRQYGIYTSTMKRKKVVVLGAGWAGYQCAVSLHKKKFDVTCVSPRNHFLFTPLLPTTTVGTLEFRCIVEPVRQQKGLRFHQANCTEIKENENKIVCQDFYSGKDFDVPYDQLIIACGARANTFNIPGVEQHCFFLKQLSDARRIRQRILQCFESAHSPSVSPQERQRLLTFVIVGGGPTNIEFAAELHDFLTQDVALNYPSLHDQITIYLIEATSQILGAFPESLGDYTTNLYRSRNITVLTSTAVQKITERVIYLSEGKEIEFGACVWNTGNSPIPFIKNLDWQKDKHGRLLIDEHCAAAGPVSRGSGSESLPNVFAIGDCAVYPTEPQAPTAQAAAQQAKWLCSTPNKTNADPNCHKNFPPFAYEHKGMLAYIGGRQALASVGGKEVSGSSAWFIWNSAYISQLMSWKNRILVPLHWAKSFVFGRDITQF
eukprot:105469_1